MSRYKKMEILRAVESSGFPIAKALALIDVPQSSYYRWKRKFRVDGLEALEDRSSAHVTPWNKILPEEKEKIFEIALHYPE